jgi:small subunit ribosomal protein S4
VRRLGPLPGFLKKQPKKTRQFPPGEHGPAAARNQRSRGTVFGKRLQAKQRLLYNYGIRERQLRSYLKLAKRVKRPMIEVVLELLESRLDTIVYRALSLPSIRAARQIVSHGHIKVNGSKLDIPSYPCQPDDTIDIDVTILTKKGGTKPKRSYYVQDAQDSPRYLRVIALHRLRHSRLPAQLDTKLIAEYYSRIL